MKEKYVSQTPQRWGVYATKVIACRQKVSGCVVRCQWDFLWGLNVYVRVCVRAQQALHSTATRKLYEALACIILRSSRLRPGTSEMAAVVYARVWLFRTFTLFRWSGNSPGYPGSPLSAACCPEHEDLREVDIRKINVNSAETIVEDAPPPTKKPRRGTRRAPSRTHTMKTRR